MGKEIETSYNSESEIRHPGVLFRGMVKDLWKSRSLAFSLLKRDISVLYRQSFLGLTWAFIPSIITTVAFTIASKNKVLNIAETDLPYPVYVMFSVALWQTFSEAVIGPVAGLTSARSFITKINFPKEALFLAKFGESIFNFLIKSLLIIAIFIFYGLTPSYGIIISLCLVFFMILLGQSIGLLLAPLNMIYHDIGKGLPLLLGFGMFVTPVVYPVPSKESILTDILKMNPLTYLISGIRDLSTKGETLYRNEILLVVGFSVLLFLLSWLVFRLSMPYVIERCP